MKTHPLITHQRQIHLDFHTSPWIGDVASEFDPTEFAQTMKAAQVNSVTVFAKCHHGQCYYPTKTGTAHPALKGRDLLGEQIEALHREGIRAPIYTTIAWEEEAATRHPEWRQMRRDGSFAQLGKPEPTNPPDQAHWIFNNFLHPDYQDHIEAHVREIMERYEFDGIFFDIVFFEGNSCWSDASIRFREQRGLMGTDRATQARFESQAQASFADRFTALVRGRHPEATVFYNSSNPIYADASAGVRTRHQLQTHWELESLPSGFWGYHHFPRLARAFGNWGKPWLGMTGRFQRMWGDFGGIKPQAALEYECFRSQALGGANSIGDQLPPRGRLDAAAYKLIGAVYQQCALAEPFYAGSGGLAQIGIVAPGDPALDGFQTDESLEGAVQMCEESHYDSVVLDDQGDFSGLDCLILPDSVVLTAALNQKLARYVQDGGKVLFSGHSAFDDSGNCQVPGVAVRTTGTVGLFPSYWRTPAGFCPALESSDRVVYLPGEEVVADNGITVLAQRVLPYFKRNELKFSSHFQTPPRAEADSHPAVLAGSNWVYFADPIFREYRQSGNIAVRDGWKAAMVRLIGTALFGSGLPSTVACIPRRRGQDLILTLLHYVPTRTALTVDMIEEPGSFAGELLCLPPAARSVKLFPSGELLPRDHKGNFCLPMAKGRLLLEVEGYFVVE